MKTIFQIILVVIVFTATAYSQQVRSSYFSVNNMNSAENIVRAYKPDEIIASTFSGVTNKEMFAFISNAIVPYAILSSNYRINDFVVLDDYIYFCGKNVTSNCGYIGMFKISTMGSVSYVNIDSSATLTKLVAYNGTRSSTTGIVAIGTPKNTSYLSCVVDLNNYYNTNSQWRYWYSQTSSDYITDVSLAGNDYVVTIGKSISSSHFYVPKLYLRVYKRYGVFLSGMENELKEFSNVSDPVNNGKYMIIPTGGDNVTVVGVTQSPGASLNPIYGIAVRKINVSSLVMNNYQFINNGLGTLEELEYFPSSNKLAILFNNPSGTGEVVFADLSKTSSYTPLKLQKENTIFTSIARYDNDYFVVGCHPFGEAMTSALPILQENLSTFTESNCSNDSSVEASVGTPSVYPTITNKPFNNTISCRIPTIKGEFLEVPQTDIKVHCANYYK